MSRSNALAAPCLLLAILACGGSESEDDASQPIDPPAKTWALKSMDGSAPLAETKITLRVDEEHGQLGGSAGCNLYCASYTTKGGALTIGRMASTLMSCAAPGATAGRVK